MPTVFVAQGGLKGRTVTTTAGTTYCSFQGIPYAKPPVGPLRFQVRRDHFSIIPTTYSNLFYIKIWEFEHREVFIQTWTFWQIEQRQTFQFNWRIKNQLDACLNKGRPTWWHLLYYVSLLLNMYRMLIHPSSGACDYLVRYTTSPTANPAT